MLLYAFSFVIQPILLLVLARHIIHYESEELWTAFMSFYMIAEVLVFISNWGGKEVVLLHSRERSAKLYTLFTSYTVLRSGIMLFLLTVYAISGMNTIDGFYFNLFCFSRLIILQFDVLWIAEQRMVGLFINEAFYYGFAIVLIFSFSSPFTVEGLFKILCLANITRLIYPVFIFRNRFTPIKLDYSSWIKWLFQGSPFFLAMIGGFVQLRIVKWVAYQILSASDFAKFDVIFSLLMFFTMGVSMLLTPFAPFIYRLQERSLTLLQRRFTGTGFLLGVFFLLVLYAILQYWMHFTFHWWIVPVVLTYCTSICFTMPDIYRLQRNKKQYVVLYLSWIGVLLDSSLCLLGGLRWGSTGIFAAIAFAQVVKTSLYFFQSRAHYV